MYMIMSCSVSSGVTASAYLTNHDFASLLPYLKAQGYHCHMYLQKVSLKVSPQGIAYIAEGTHLQKVPSPKVAAEGTLQLSMMKS